MTIRVLALDSPERWTDLEALLGAGQGNPLITGNLVRHLRELGARSVLIDDDYIDRDSAKHSVLTTPKHSKDILRFASAFSSSRANLIS